MIELNLLPPEEKNNFRLEQIQRWVIFYGGGALSTILIWIILLGGIWSFIALQTKTYSLNVENTKTSSQGQSVKEQQKLINELNQQLAKIYKVQQDHHSSAGVLTALSQILPAGARFDGLTMDENGQVILSGFAIAREQVMALKEALEKSALFEKVESPLSNLVKQNNINFSFKFNLRAQALKDKK